MILSRRQKKLWHATYIGFVTGVLAAGQAALTVGLTEKRALGAALIGILAGGLARAAGALLDGIQTDDTPQPPETQP